MVLAARALIRLIIHIISNLKFFQNHEVLLSGFLRAGAIDILYCPRSHVHVLEEY
jgi:hypothetical protein